MANEAFVNESHFVETIDHLLCGYAHFLGTAFYCHYSKMYLSIFLCHLFLVVAMAKLRLFRGTAKFIGCFFIKIRSIWPLPFEVLLADAELLADEADGLGREEALGGVEVEVDELVLVALHPATEGVDAHACCLSYLRFGV